MATYEVNCKYQQAAAGRGGSRNPEDVDRTVAIRRWVKDSLWLYWRASQCLKETLARQKLTPPKPIPESVKKILDGLLGASATEADYKTVIEVFDQVGQLGAAPRSSPQHDILFRFITGDVSLAPSSEPAKVYPVDLTRIGGAFTPKMSDPAKFTSDQKAYLRESSLRALVDDPLAKCVTNSPEDLEAQKKQTDSRKDWNDILMADDWKDASNPATYGSLSEWRSGVGASDWSRPKIIGKCLIDREIGVVTVMHELIHSDLLVKPSISGHGKIGQRSANGLVNVLKLAQSQGPAAALKNPDTYAFLAICLSMPWYIWWDSNLAKLDGVCRDNPCTDGAKLKDWSPLGWVPPGWKDQKKIKDELAARGPFCFNEKNEPA